MVDVPFNSCESTLKVVDLSKLLVVTRVHFGLLPLIVCSPEASVRQFRPREARGHLDGHRGHHPQDDGPDSQQTDSQAGHRGGGRGR